MLVLKDIKKEYKVADSTVHALKGISLSFRKSEFVSILGPSGCGKTTLLNIIGGLDKYTSGDLNINGKSTKEFKSKDWDIYRNHRIGFIFQSYNLISHQTVLGNVELALTISGMNKSERIKKAKQALDKVGLSDQYNKRPNQLSGGQSQRVAIARALVNDPEILLADEPTGALDTETSVQIMDLIKDIAKDRLVIMVTHNPELAEQYSSRIIRLLDGNVLSDSKPFDITKEKQKKTKQTKQPEVVVKKKEKSKMSFWTAFKLSLQNLFTKKARTTLTSIAGSIGIIGVSLVLTLSFGIQSYITSMQNDMLSGYPIEISKTALDIESFMNSMPNQEKLEIVKEAGFVNVDSTIEQIMKRSADLNGVFVNNDITQNYVDFINNMPKEDVANILFEYGIDITNNLYTDIKQDSTSTEEVMSLSTIRAIYTAMLKKTEYSNYASLIPTLANTFAQAPTSEDYVLSQYELQGNFATEKNQIMIVLDNNNMLSDLLLAQLGYYTQEEFLNLVYKASSSPSYNPALEKTKFSYDTLLNKTFTWYPNNNLYNQPANILAPFTYNSYHDNSFTDGIELEVVGILTPKEELSFGSLSSGFYYTEKLTKHILQTDTSSEIVEYLNDNNLDGFYGMKIEAVEGSGIYKDLGVTLTYSFKFEDETITQTTYLGQVNTSLGMLGGGGSQTEIAILSLAQLGGSSLPEKISISPTNFKTKDNVLAYLDKWNSENDITLNVNILTQEDRNKITYTDNLSLVISMIQTLINVITIALVGFTALSLVVSSVMISIITYVSVVERVKEIGVIRSLGGRKKDVSNLFNAETFIIGLASGLIGIGFTYLVSFIINLIVMPQIKFAIAIFPINYALIMLSVSVLLTLISGLMPARAAAKKDPAVALRME